jgi:hypothetical protein
VRDGYSAVPLTGPILTSMSREVWVPSRLGEKTKLGLFPGWGYAFGRILRKQRKFQGDAEKVSDDPFLPVTAEELRRIVRSFDLDRGARKRAKVGTPIASFGTSPGLLPFFACALSVAQ